MLALNRPPVAVRFDAGSGSLVAWGRLPLAGFTPQHGAGLVWEVLDCVQALRERLRPAGGAAGTSAGALLRTLNLPVTRQ